MLTILPSTLSGASEHEISEVIRGIKSLAPRFAKGSVTPVPGNYLMLKCEFPSGTEWLTLVDETFDETVRELRKLSSFNGEGQLVP